MQEILFDILAVVLLLAGAWIVTSQRTQREPQIPSPPNIAPAGRGAWIWIIGFALAYFGATRLSSGIIELLDIYNVLGIPTGPAAGAGLAEGQADPTLRFVLEIVIELLLFIVALIGVGTLRGMISGQTADQQTSPDNPDKQSRD